MYIQAIVATDINGGIGIDNKLPWPHNKPDMKNFSQLTKETIVVMGSNTWKSLPDLLKNRYNVVLSTKDIEDLTNRKGNVPHEVINGNSVQDIYQQLEMISTKTNCSVVSIIGGKKVYEQLIDIIDTIHYTVFNASFECDTDLDMESLLTHFEIVKESIDLDDNVSYRVWAKTN